jgi:transcriptional regulator with XRE-family HTH domain
VEHILITPAQCRMARSLLNWTQTQLAEHCDLAPMTITKFEKEGGDKRPEARTLEKIRRAFESGGVEFTDYEGVRRKPRGIITFKGRDGFAEFIWDVYETAKTKGGEICVSNVDEALFTDWLGIEVDTAYMEKMKELDNFNFKILVQEGDWNFTASSYAEYKWVPKEQFFSVPFYVYGDKLAFLLFGEDVNIHVIDNPDIAAAQRQQFDMSWKTAIIPKRK